MFFVFERKKGSNLLYWLLLGIVLFVFSYLLVHMLPYYGAVFKFVWKLLLPFLIAALIAYLLYPLVEKINSLNIHKGLAILMLYLVFFGGIGYLFYRGYPAIVHQLHDLNQNLPQFIEMYQGWIYQIYSYTSFLPEAVHDRIDEMILTVETSLDNILAKLVGGFEKIIDMVITITVIPVLVFYFIKDYGKISGFFSRLIPARYRDESSLLMKQVDKGLGGYIRGQLIVSLFVSIASLVAFFLLKIKYSLLLAILMGVTNIIPYFGPIIGAVPTLAITYTTDGSKVIFVLLAIFIIQILEGNLLSPYIMGKTVEVHPVAIIFVLLLGGKLFGIWGLILAVPLLTISKVIVIQLLAFRSNH